jgi:hypothetical protein
MSQRHSIKEISSCIRETLDKMQRMVDFSLDNFLSCIDNEFAKVGTFDPKDKFQRLVI